MAFDGHRSTLANALFPTYQGQLSLNVGGGNNGSVALPFGSIPNGSLQDTESFTPWSHNVYDDPYEAVNSAQSSIKMRIPDSTDCDGETDLQGLVSNILDEADYQDSYYSEGSLPTCNSIWSPLTLREELLQYLESEAKAQHGSTFPSNTYSKAQGQSMVRQFEELYQYSSGAATNQQLLFHLPNGGGDSYTPYPQKPSPGMPVSNITKTCMPQTQQSLYENVSVDKDSGSSYLMPLPDLSDVFRHPGKMNSPSFEDCYTQNITKTKPLPQDINQLVSSFQSLMAVEHDGFNCRDFPDMNKQLLGMQSEEQWKITSSPVSRQKSPAIQTSKQLLGDFGTVQRNEDVAKQIFKPNAFQELPGFHSQHPKCFQQHKPSSAFLKHPHQYQDNLSMNKGNMNTYQHCTQEGQMQSKVKSQLPKDKKMMHMSGSWRDGFSGIPLPNTFTREGDKKQALSQTLYFLQGGMQPQKLDEENGNVLTRKTHQIMPSMYSVNDPRRYSSIPINLNSGGTLSYRDCLPGLDVDCKVSSNESPHFSSYVSEIMPRRGENTYHSMAPVSPTPMVMNPGGPMVQLYLFVDECYEQWRCLEKERKKTEVILAKTFPGKRTAAVSNSYQLKTPPNATRVDHLIVKQIREKAKVASLLDRMEYLHNNPLHMNIHTSLNRHHMAICTTQARRKEEIANMSKHQQHRTHFTEDRDTLLLVLALKDLAATTRKLRTALWCALQMTLPKLVDNPDHYAESKCNETCSSSFEGYSFKI